MRIVQQLVGVGAQQKEKKNQILHKIINENNETLNEGTILSNIYQDEMI